MQIGLLLVQSLTLVFQYFSGLNVDLLFCQKDNFYQKFPDYYRGKQLGGFI
jgi:hypothetical protein